VSFALRRAGPEDAPTVQALFCRSFKATFGHLYPAGDLAEFLDGCRVERFAQELQDAENACMMGIGPDGGLAGYCLLGPMDLPVETVRRWWVLRQLYLEEEAKGSRLADALMAWAVAEARLRGYRELLLTVWIGNHRARRFYERHGFEEVGRYPFRVGSTVDDDRILRLSL
jgi:ribosomal protein S18 acetylase RimI-like enzyme